MNDELRLLIELQNLDSVILTTRRKMDAIPGTIAAEEGPLNAARTVYENARQNHISLEKKKKTRESDIEDLGEKISKLKKRGAEIKNNKEYQAHLKEIEKAEKELRIAEDGLISVMESLEESVKLIEAENTRLSREQSKIDAVRAELEKEVAALREELDSLKKDRSVIAEKIDPGTYKLYMTILKAGRGLAVAEASNEICQGCNIHIPPQMFVEIKTNNDVIHCPQCRRILYYVSTPAEETAKADGGGSMKGFLTENTRL